MKTTRYVRYSRPLQSGHPISYGILEGETIQELRGDIFAGASPPGTTLSIRNETTRAPCALQAAVGRNYQSHIKAMSQMTERTIPPRSSGLFWKPSSCIIGTEEHRTALRSGKCAL